MTPPESKPDDAETGLPGLRSWPAVYVFVLAAFILWIVLLVALTRAFSSELSSNRTVAADVRRLQFPPPKSE